VRIIQMLGFLAFEIRLQRTPAKFLTEARYQFNVIPSPSSHNAVLNVNNTVHGPSVVPQNGSIHANAKNQTRNKPLN